MVCMSALISFGEAFTSLFRASLSSLNWPLEEVLKAAFAAASMLAYCLQFSRETSASLDELLELPLEPLEPLPLLWLLDDELSPPLLLEESSFFLPPQATRRTTSEMETKEKRSLLRDTGLPPEVRIAGENYNRINLPVFIVAFSRKTKRPAI
jgi:hypothetical protein